MNLSGIVAIIFGFGIACVGAAYSVISLILALVFRKPLRLGVFKQRSGAFLIGGLFQTMSGLLLFLFGTDFLSDSHMRHQMDELTFVYTGGILFVTIVIIISRFIFVSRKYYANK